MNTSGSEPGSKPRASRLNLAGEPIIVRLTPALGHGVPIDGLKVVARRGWFATRPSGAENFDKIYAKSFVDLAHPDTNVAGARTIVGRATGSSA